MASAAGLFAEAAPRPAPSASAAEDAELASTLLLHNLDTGEDMAIDCDIGGLQIKAGGERTRPWSPLESLRVC